MRFSIVPVTLAVCRLPHDADVPPWAMAGDIFSVTRTLDELSIVCDETAVAPGVLAERGWGVVKLEGPIPFNQVGVISAVTSVLGAVGLSVFALSTYDTDYILVRQTEMQSAIAALRLRGYDLADQCGT